jgi:hypothetical protein
MRGRHIIYGLAALLAGCGHTPEKPVAQIVIPSDSYVLTAQELHQLNQIPCSPATEMAMDLSMVLRNRPELAVITTTYMVMRCPVDAAAIAQIAINANPYRAEPIVASAIIALPADGNAYRAAKTQLYQIAEQVVKK